MNQQHGRLFLAGLCFLAAVPAVRAQHGPDYPPGNPPIFPPPQRIDWVDDTPGRRTDRWTAASATSPRPKTVFPTG